MEQGGSFDVAATRSALNQLASLLGQANFRESFRDDPRVAVQKAGVNPDDLPGDVVELLRSMSHEELQIVASVHATLVAAIPDSAEVGIVF